MTTPSTERKAGPFNGNGSTTAFPFGFKVFAAGDVRVTVADGQGVERVLVLNTDYTVTLNPNQETSPGGTINHLLPNGHRLSVTGDIDYDQPLDIPNGGNFNPVVLENQLDRSTMQIQQLAEQMGRAVKVPVTEEGDGELSNDLARGILRLMDSADNIDTVVDNLPTVNTVATNIADVNTVASNIGNVAATGANIAAVVTVANDLNEPVSEIDTVATNIADVNTVGQGIGAVNAVAANIADVNTVVANIADVQTVADNVADVTNFADVYYGPRASDPTTRNDGSPPQLGDLYFNTGSKRQRTFDGAAWVEGSTIPGTYTVDVFSGNGTETAFALSVDPVSKNNTQVFIGGVYQQKSQYGVAGGAITFTTAPPAGTNNVEVATTTTASLGTVDSAFVPFAATTVKDALSKAVLSYPDYAAASAAAATLPDGQRVMVGVDGMRNGRVTKHTVQAGALVFDGFAESAANSTTNVAWFSSGRTEQQALEAAFAATSGRVELNQDLTVASVDPAQLKRLVGDGSVTIGAQVIYAGDIPTTGTVIAFPGVFADWRDLWSYLDTRRVLGTLTINVVANYTFNGHWIEPRHPDGARVKVIGQGKSLTRFTFTNLPPAVKAAGVKLSDGYKLGLVDKITLDGDNWSGHSNGGPTLGAGNPDDPIGVLARDGGIINLGNDVDIYRFARNGALTYNGGHVWSPSGVRAIECGSDGFGASTGGSTVVDGSVADGCYGYGYYSDYGGDLWASNTTAQNTKQRAGVGGGGFCVAHGGTMKVNGSVSKKNATDGYVNLGGTFYADGAIAGGSALDKNGARGFRSSAGGKTYASNFTSTHNTGEGLSLQSGAVFFGDNLVSTNNGSNGAYTGTGCVLESTNANLSNNSGGAIVSEKSASVSLLNLTADGNTSNGINATGCNIHVRTATSIKNNGGYGVLARYGGCVDLRSTNKATVITGNASGAISATEVTGTGIPQSFVWLPA